VDGVAEKALECGADRVVIVDRGQGGPSRIEFFRVGASGLVSVPPVFDVAGIRLRREFRHAGLKPTRSLAITILSKEDEETIKVSNALSSFFNIPAFLANEKPSKYKRRCSFLAMPHTEFKLLLQTLFKTFK